MSLSRGEHLQTNSFRTDGQVAVVRDEPVG
jgi:hypothetical protein